MFWQTEGANVKASKISELIKENADIEDIIQEEHFIQEYNSQKPEIIEILSKKEIQSKLIDWMYNTSPKEPYSF